MRTVIFDLDGTLADTSGDLLAAANACFQARGFGDVLYSPGDAATALRGGRAMLRLGASRLGDAYGEAEVEADYQPLLDYYADSIDQHTFLYPGAAEAVEGLRQRGYVTAICTNKPEGLAETLMTRLGVRNLFDSLVGGDSLAVRKPDAAPVRAAAERAGGGLDHAVIIGDTDTDANAGRAAGIKVALVGFGPEGGAIQRLEPDAILEDYQDLGNVVAELIG